MNKQKKSGFEPLEGFENQCFDPSHEPPMHLLIPPYKQYRHVCRGCGRERVIRGSGVRFCA